MGSIKVAGLYCHPVKSMRGVDSDRLSLVKTGFEHDRHWMVVDAEGVMLTQRVVPKMARLLASVDGGRLVISDGSESIVGWEQEAGDAKRKLTVQVWGDRVSAEDCGDSVAAWLQQRLGVSCRLVYYADREQRGVDTRYGQRQDRVAFSDGFPLLLISQASLDCLSKELGSVVDPRRFRPNILVQGCAPFEEDSWSKIAIGGIEFELVKPCERCVIPSLDPYSGEPTAGFVRSLAKLRRIDGKILFGQNLIHRGIGDIAVGAEMTVLETRT